MALGGREQGNDQDCGSGKLPHEASRDEFIKAWQPIDVQVLGGPHATSKKTKKLQIPWNTFPIPFLVEDLDPIAQSEVYHCHEFVKSVSLLAKIGSKNADPVKHFGKSSKGYSLDDARKLLRRARHENTRQTLEDQFPLPAEGGPLKLSSLWKSFIWSTPYQARERAISAVEFISPEIERFYFGRAKQYVAEGIASENITEDSGITHAGKVRTVDLPSFKDFRTQHVVLSSVVESVWHNARQAWATAIEKDAAEDDRVPTFIVLEEAHNIVPDKSDSFSAKALREQFRTIAAEGRKYGVFLLLCTQRPDKIDPFIISECENRAVMRLGAKSVLEDTRKLLGLEDINEKTLHKCLEFQTGRFLLAGPWSGESPKLGYSAMRRTVEGGRNLRSEHWAVSEKASTHKPDEGPTSDDTK